VPTGKAIHDAREQLFDAAERVLLRDGPRALTSRAVTQEAGVAKGVLHRHFVDFDAFVVELVADRARRVGDQSKALQACAGSGTVAGNLAGALTELFGSVALSIVGLLIFRDDLRARLRQAGLMGVPVASEATVMVASYLSAERELGRIASDADIATLARVLVGTGHLLFAGREGSPEPADVHRAVATALAGTLPATVGALQAAVATEQNQLRDR
jgi:AcrR family transcriptional regulator